MTKAEYIDELKKIRQGMVEYENKCQKISNHILQRANPSTPEPWDDEKRRRIKAFRQIQEMDDKINHWESMPD